MRGTGGLIAFEGIDGCGKSTQAGLLARRLDALLTFEPGATRLGASLRTLLLDRDQPTPGERTEALLLAADRAQHVTEVIRPALDQGGWVVSDRFSASTLAYQGYGRGLDRVEVDRLIEWATGGLTPDLTVLLDVSPEVGRARRQGSPEDRIEVMGEEFRQRVVDGYRVLAATEATPWLVVDGTGPVEDVAAAVWSGVQDHVVQVGARDR
jgi:dTMP kinase